MLLLIPFKIAYLMWKATHKHSFIQFCPFLRMCYKSQSSYLKSENGCIFSVGCSWNSCPPAICASTANVVCRNIDLFKEEMFPINHILFSPVLLLLTYPYHEFKHICYNSVSILYFFSFWLRILINEIGELFVLPWALLCLVFVCLHFLSSHATL